VRAELHARGQGRLARPREGDLINEQFQQSRQLWSTLVDRGVLDAPSTFINATPHMTFVRGEKDVAYLTATRRSRAAAVRGIEYSEDSRVINQWAPLLMQQRRKGEPFAATRVPAGTDVDFGALTASCSTTSPRTASRCCEHRGAQAQAQKDGTWNVRYRNARAHPGQLDARFVFVGAGGWAIKLLQDRASTRSRATAASRSAASG
jgi:malate dehydrogenase (quinone)